MPSAPRFPLVLGGYDRLQVEELVGQITAALASEDPSLRSEALGLVQQARLTMQIRGYDRSKVDAYLDQSRVTLTS